MLGSDSPVVLRRNPRGTLQVVGCAYALGLDDGEALLGKLAHPWKLEFVHTSIIGIEKRFVNTSTGTITSEDPRLGPMPEEWEGTDQEPADFDSHFGPWCRNKLTGEIINSDPRLLPDALRARGVELQTFALE